MSYNDSASHRSYGRSSRGRDDYYDDRGDYRDAYREDRSDGRRDRGRDSYYYDQAPPADNSALARRQQLPVAYRDDEPSTRSSARSYRTRSRSRSRSRSVSPSLKKTVISRRGEIIAGVAGAVALTAADKFLIEPRMNKGKGKNHKRSKSHHEALRRAADVGVGGLAGSQIYRAVSRSRVRERAKSLVRHDSSDSRGRSESRGRGRSDSDDSRSRSRSKSKGGHWKALLSSGAGALAGLAAEQVRKRSESRKREKSRGGKDSSSDDSGRSRSSRRSRTRGGDDNRSRRRHDSSDGGSDRDDHDRRERRRNKDKDRGSRNKNPHEGRDLLQEAIGLIGVAQGMRGKNKGKAAMETAIGAAGLAQNYYEHHKANGRPPR